MEITQYDLEAHRIIEFQIIKKWFKTETICLYYYQNSFTIEIQTKSLFNRKSEYYPNLSWLEASHFFFKELSNDS